MPLSATSRRDVQLPAGNLLTGFGNEGSLDAVRKGDRSPIARRQLLAPRYSTARTAASQRAGRAAEVDRNRAELLPPRHHRHTRTHWCRVELASKAPLVPPLSTRRPRVMRQRVPEPQTRPSRHQLQPPSRPPARPIDASFLIPPFRGQRAVHVPLLRRAAAASRDDQETDLPQQPPIDQRH